MQFNEQDLDALSNSFFIGGANAVLATHWELDSAVAEVFTTSFIANFFESPDEGLAAALKKTRNEMARTQDRTPCILGSIFTLRTHWRDRTKSLRTL